MEKFKAWLAAENGRVTALAASLDISQPAVSQWERVPAERVLEVERITGISRYELRPDVFGTELLSAAS
jgi:DNA-binding transcriptional regulator YdaS (Cro superfamily)